MESLSHNKRVHSDSDDHLFNSPEAKRIRHELLDSPEDSDSYTLSQDLDSFIKSFEDEISPPLETVELSSDSAESRPGLEFLLEASDDELGLPPTESEKIPSLTQSGEPGLFSWLDDQVPNYDPFGNGFGYADGDVNGDGNRDFNGNFNGEYVGLDGLFDCTDVGFGGSDLAAGIVAGPVRR
ncbi:hypothetical protein SSX86_016007 [Deinandra increscens subsp. villosa]|uniref:Uncharacterized protein n=1 Tax=Deinandra increscens subsp. villosa TaxID=3103831 RepID=A0AAP0D1V3_9ASTR